MRNRNNVLNSLILFFTLGILSLATVIFAGPRSFAVYAESIDDHDEIEVADYYFDADAPSGGDGSYASPYNSIASDWSKISWGAGAVVRFKSGGLFLGPLNLFSISGAEPAPVIIGKYGAGALPKIYTNDNTGSGVIYIKDCENITVQDIEVFDTASLEGDRRGVFIEIGGGTSSSIKEVKNITVQNLYIHDIRGITDFENSGMSTESKKTGGIVAHARDAYTVYDGLSIKGNTVKNVDSAGISIWKRMTTAAQIKAYDAGFEEQAHKNMLISGNVISEIGKNAIVVRYLLGGKVSNNTVFKTALTSVSGNQIFTKDCKGTIIENNEGFLNMATADDAGVVRDGSMLDPDLRSPDTVWQYNYSHDNTFGLMTNCTDANDEVTVRYNISIADKGYLMNFNYDVARLHVYNNTFFIPEGSNAVIINERKQKMGTERVSGQNYIFENNLIYNDSKTASFDFAVQGESGTQNDIINTLTRSFSNNLLYSSKSGQSGFTLNKGSLFGKTDGKSASVAQPGYVQSDPMLVNAFAGAPAQRIGAEFCNNMKLQTGSPALNTGKIIAGTDGQKDFFGNTISTPPNIGAYGGGGEADDSVPALNPSDFSTARFDAEVIKNIVYAPDVTNYDGTKRDLKLDIYRPKGDFERNRPLIVMIHGGGFRSDSTKEQSYIVNLSTLFAKHGYVVAAIEYRLRKAADMPTKAEEVPALSDSSYDTDTAVAWLREKGGLYGYNPDYMFVAGGSAGGRTAVAYAYADSLRVFDTSGVVAVGNLWGSPEAPFRTLYNVANRKIPMVIVHGTNDTTIPTVNADEMETALVAAGYINGTDYRYHKISGGGHPPTNVSNGTNVIFGQVNTFFIERLAAYISVHGITAPPVPEYLPDLPEPQKPQSDDSVMYPIGNTYVINGTDEEQRSVNYEDTKLSVYGNAAAGRRTAYLKFNLAKADSITARLTVKVVSTTATMANPQLISVYDLNNNNFLVQNITYLARPDESSKQLLGHFIVAGAGEYKLDITALAAAKAGGGAAAISLMLTDGQNTADIKTELGSVLSAGNEPKIVYTDETGAPGGTAFEAVADTYVTSSSKNPTATGLTAKQNASGSQTARAFIKFDLTTLSEPINAAALNLFLAGMDAGTTRFSLRVSTLDNWTEDGLEWGTSPHPNVNLETSLAQTVDVAAEGVWLNIDIKNILENAAFTDNNIITFGIYPSSNSSGVTVGSKESENKPYIMINKTDGAAEEFNINASVDGGGGTFALSAVKAAQGGSVTLMVLPDSGYAVESVTVNGVQKALTGKLLIIGNVSAHQTIVIKYYSRSQINAAEDTFTRQDAASANNGSGNYIEVKTTKGTNSRIGYIKFDLTGQNLSSDNIIFRIYGYRGVDLGGRDMPISVYGFTCADWSESTLNWSNQFTAPLLDYGAGTDVAGENASARFTKGAYLGTLNCRNSQWYELDVTEYVRSLAQCGIKEFTIALLDACNDGTPRFEFYSADSGTNVPHLLPVPSGTHSEPETVTVTVDCGTNGAAYGAGSFSAGQARQILFAPAAGYRIDAVTVNGESVSIVNNKLVLNSVTANTTVSVTFKRI